VPAAFVPVPVAPRTEPGVPIVDDLRAGEDPERREVPSEASWRRVSYACADAASGVDTVDGRMWGRADRMCSYIPRAYMVSHTYGEPENAEDRQELGQG
jgi:hypothetical protein